MVYDFPAGREIDQRYYERALEVSLVRIQQAGIRLAFTLNEIAGGTLEPRTHAPAPRAPLPPLRPTQSPEGSHPATP